MLLVTSWTCANLNFFLPISDALCRIKEIVMRKISTQTKLKNFAPSDGLTQSSVLPLTDENVLNRLDKILFSFDAIGL